MKPIRRERVASFLREEIARIIQRELRDPRVGLITVTRVEPTVDLKEATVHISVLGDEAEARTAIRGLEAAAGFIQQQVGSTHSWRQNPQLKFELDDSIRKQFEMEELLRRAREEDGAEPSAKSVEEPEQADGDDEEA
ncbi:MAG: 30S ribosome-binding factor RbfA [Planctomycetota bacterium]